MSLMMETANNEQIISRLLGEQQAATPQQILSADDNQVMINPAYKYTWIPKPAEPFN